MGADTRGTGEFTESDVRAVARAVAHGYHEPYEPDFHDGVARAVLSAVSLPVRGTGARRGAADITQTLVVALDEWGKANCNTDYRTCADPFCREFAAAREALASRLSSEEGKNDG